MTNATDTQPAAASPLDNLAAAVAAPPANREEWLHRAAALLAPLFIAAGSALPSAVRYSCGWTSLGRRSRRPSEHWGPSSSADDTHEIFVTPRLDDAIEVLQALTHELVHATVFPTPGHGPEFRQLALAVGLRGHMTKTTAGAQLIATLQSIHGEIGPYPHGSLTDAQTSTTPTQGTRMIKCECLACGYSVRGSKRWFDLATPICPMGHGHMRRNDTGQIITFGAQTNAETGMIDITTSTISAPVAAPDAPAPELAAAPFSNDEWFMRAAIALGGENLDPNVIDSFILVESCNPALQAGTATDATASRVNGAATDGAYASAGNGNGLATINGRTALSTDNAVRRNGRKATSRKIKRPDRIKIVRSMRDLVAKGFIAWTDEASKTFHVTEHGSTHTTAPEATDEQHAAVSTVRMQRFAALDFAELATAPKSVVAPSTSGAARFANLDLD